MELLNNIWTALSAPNEGLMNFIFIPAMIIENYLTLMLVTLILDLKLSRKQKLIYFLIVSIIGLISIGLLPNPFNVFFNYLMITTIVCLTFKISFLKSFFAIIISALIFNFLGALLLNPFIKIFKITTEELSIVPIYRIFYMSTFYICMSIIIITLKKTNILHINFLEKIDKKTRYMIILNLSLGIIAIVVQSIIAVYYTNNLPIIITFLSFVSLLAYFGLSIYSLTKAFKLVSTTQKLESAEEYNHTLHILHDNVRGFKHDFDNIITTIGGYIKTEDMDGLKNYYSQLEDDAQRVNNLYILNPDVINNDGIYNLLTKKYNEAEEKDIKINMTFLLDLNTLNMKIYEFARILGILLDNAIEASSECDEKIINITFKDDPKNSRQLVIVENTFKDTNLDTEKIFEKGFSGKENHTGLGLWEVRKLVKKNKNINLFTNKKDKLFSQQLEIYSSK